jgi:hypothetical protein
VERIGPAGDVFRPRRQGLGEQHRVELPGDLEDRPGGGLGWNLAGVPGHAEQPALLLERHMDVTGVLEEAQLDGCRLDGVTGDRHEVDQVGDFGQGEHEGLVAHLLAIRIISSSIMLR